MGGGGDAPEPDPNIGLAALKSAELGEDYFAWMRQRARLTDRWAKADRKWMRGVRNEDRAWLEQNRGWLADDRARLEDVFQPMQDAYIADAKNWDSPAAQRAAAREAVADVSQNIKISRDAAAREAAAMGIDPNSPRYNAGRHAMRIDAGLARAGAANVARRQRRAQGIDMRRGVAGFGSSTPMDLSRTPGGDPLAAYTAGTSAGSRGFEGAMAGYGQQGHLLNQQYQNQLQAWQAGQDSQGALFGAAGTLAGMTSGTWMPFLMASDEKGKTKRRKARGFLDAVQNMDTGVWEYKPDTPGGDGGGQPHAGPMAQDFKRETGLGDGKSIAVVDAIGVTMGAVKELAEEVKALKSKPRRRVARGMADAA